MDKFSVIRAGLEAVQQRMKVNPELANKPTPLLKRTGAPVLFKELKPKDEISNQFLLSFLPSILPLDILRSVLHFFDDMMDARASDPDVKEGAHNDPRSQLDAPPLHFGIWRKYCNALGWTTDTLAGSLTTVAATMAFLMEVEKIAAILSPIIEKVYPRFMERQHE
jgi:hypothetical protein